MEGLEFFLLVIGAICSVVFDRYYFRQEIVTRRVKIISKRTFVFSEEGPNAGEVSYDCTFEFENGEQSDYEVSESHFISIAEGDRGELDTDGGTFVGFRRDP